MAENRIYLALGEEAVRGGKESTAVGYIPLQNPGIPRMEFDDKRRKEFRGEEAAKGDTAVLRSSRKWSATIETPFFTEAGGVKGMTGTLLKHLLGHAASAQEGLTGQYRHMMYPAADPFAPGELDTKALTFNLNINEGSVMRNWPFVGGRVKSVSFIQDAGNSLKVSAELFGQKKDASTDAIAGASFAAENLRCDYNNLKVYTGAVTRVGTAPDFTDFTFSGATQIRPDKVSVKIENGMEDILRLSGLDYPDKTRMGQFKVSLEMTVDWEDPASGFSSVAEFNAWASSGSSTNFCLHWDTGTQAGSGGNHGLYIDLPVMQRTGAAPDYNLNKDPMATLKYEGLYDAAATQYMVGVLLKNTAEVI